MGMLRKWCQKCSDEIQGSDPIASLTSSGSELHHPMVTAAKADLILTFLSSSSLFQVLGPSRLHPPQSPMSESCSECTPEAS